MVTSGTRGYSLGFSTNDRRAMSYLELHKINWGETPTPLLSILHKHKLRWCKPKQSLVAYLHSTNQHILSFYTFPWYNRQTVLQWLIQEALIVPPASSCFFTLGRLKHSPRTSNFFLVLNLLVSAQKNWHILLLSVFTTCWIHGGLDAKGSVISLSAGGRKLEPGKICALILNEPKTTVPNPLTLCAKGNPAGKVNKRTISLQIKHNVWADLSWVSELQGLKISFEHRIWLKPR